jgi:hypothetical protein
MTDPLYINLRVRARFECNSLSIYRNKICLDKMLQRQPNYMFYSRYASSTSLVTSQIIKQEGVIAPELFRYLCFP